MDESDSLISSEWDIVGPSSLENKEDIKEDELEEEVIIYSPENANKDDVLKGSSVEDVLEEQECQTNCGGSCSSSDIDIIDDAALDECQNNISIPSIELSLSSSFEQSFSPSIPSLPESEHIPDSAVNTSGQSDRPLRNTHLKDYFVFLCVGCLLAVFMHLPETPVDAIKEMEKRIMKLQEENKELKNQMVSKSEDDKLYIGLEEQILALKDENLKLSTFMQDLIHQMEEKTIIFKKESEIKGKESYQNEINKLKEQVNILQIDNDDLQKQLVRMRYGIYSPRPQDPESHDTSHTNQLKEDNGNNENSTEMLSEEIKELRKKLYSEVGKLKQWKDSVQHLVKELENRSQELENKNQVSENKNQGSESKESFDGTKSSDDENAYTSKNRKKHRYERFLNDLNSHFNEAYNHIPQLNLTDLVVRYMGVDKKTVKGVFESVNRYFKKAQEKTKDIYDKQIKDDMWKFIGGLRKQWHGMKKTYFQKAEKSHQSEPNQKNNLKPRNNPEVAKEEKQTTHTSPSDVEKEFKSQPNARIQDQLKSSYKQKLENSAETTVPINSWVFERAAHRSELRENEEDVNWFLKNRKDGDDLEPDNVEQNEPVTDPFENVDLFALD